MTAFLLAAVLAAAQPASPPAPVWTISGLSEPESVVYDEGSQALYISNINGDPASKDGNGFITKAGLDGKVVKLKWASGLNAPKGLKVCGGKLYAADIDQVVAISLATGKIESRVFAPGAKFLNDIAADGKCRLYVSDMFGSALYVVSGGAAKLWMDGPDLHSPNGLAWLKDRLVVAAWGLSDGGESKTQGRLLAIEPVKQAISPLPGPYGHLDGVERYKDGWLLTDWMAGTLLRAEGGGKTQVLLRGLEGPADFAIVPARGLLLLPETKRGLLTAYRLSALAR